MLGNCADRVGILAMPVTFHVAPSFPSIGGGAHVGICDAISTGGARSVRRGGSASCSRFRLERQGACTHVPSGNCSPTAQGAVCTSVYMGDAEHARTIPYANSVARIFASRLDILLPFRRRAIRARIVQRSDEVHSYRFVKIRVRRRHPSASSEAHRTHPARRHTCYPIRPYRLVVNRKPRFCLCARHCRLSAPPPGLHRR